MASEISAILGLSPYESPWDVWARKVEEVPEKPETPAMAAGNALEPVIGKLYEQRTQERIWPVTKTERHPDYSMVAATPDWLVENASRVVEAKAALSMSSQREYGDEISGIFPERHAVQAMIQMACFNRDETALAALVGAELRIYKIQRDRDAERDLLDHLAAWWDRHVVKGDPPPMDGSEGASEWLRRKFPKNTGQILKADAHATTTIQGLIECREILTATEAEIERRKNELCQLIADKDGIEAPGIGKVTWKLTKATERTDWDCVASTLAKFAPEGEFDRIVETHTTTKPGTRRFCVYPEKET